jgi:glucokinase
MIALGIDIGGTKIVGGIIDGTGNILVMDERATNASKGKDYILEGLSELITKLNEQHTADVIGIGSAGRINTDEGTVYYATPNLPNWAGLNLKQYIEDRHRIPTVVDNDVNVAGIGEKWLGAGKNFQSVVCLTLGTGIAAAVFVDGKIVRGNHWSTGEIGHMILYPKGKLCNCGQRGCFEQYCSGTSLYLTYNELQDKLVLSSGKEYFKLLESGDSIARSLLDTFIDDLAIAFVSLANIYDPEVFIVGGGLIYTREHWWEELERRIKLYANSAVSGLTLLPAAYKNQAGMLGAAKLGFDYLDSLKKN